MPTAMVTFNGRITLPPNVRKELGLKTGDNVEFVKMDGGKFAIVSSSEPVMHLVGAPARREMDEALCDISKKN